MKTCIFGFVICVLAGQTVCRASDLKPALESFAAYEYGQAKKVLHDTRMAAFRDTHNQRLRLENERLLLAFIQSDASISARREACMWLSDLGTEASRSILTQLVGQKDFADVAQIALDALETRKTGIGQVESASGQFKAGVLKSSSKLDALTLALGGEDDAQARIAFQLIGEGLEVGAACTWMEQHIGELDEARQLLALNLMVQVNAAEKAAVIPRLSRDGKGSARLTAIRLSSDVTMLDQLLFGSDPVLAGAAKQALIALPQDVVGPYLVEELESPEATIQAVAIEIVSARPDSYPTQALQAIAGQEGHANQKAAIRALGKVGDVNRYPMMLDAYVASEGHPLQKDWQVALWEMSRRHPNYAQASAALKKSMSGATEMTAEKLASLEKKLMDLKPATSLKDVRDPPKSSPQATVAPTRRTIENILHPGSYANLVPERFEVAAYLNGGPQHRTQANGITIACSTGTGWNLAAGTDPSLSLLFADSDLDFTLAGLKSGQDYILGMTWWDSHGNGRRQSILINGREVLPATPAICYDQPNGGAKTHAGQGRPSPTRIQFALLPEHVQDGTCQVRIRRRGPANAVTSELWILQRSQPRAEKQALLVTGQDYPGHFWRKTAPVVASLIAEDRRMEVTICETPFAVGLKHLASYDAIFVHFKNYAEDMPSTPAMRNNLQAYVFNGGGMVLSHFACGAFMEWPQFVNLSGRIWNRGGHDPRGPFTVKVVDRTHPVTRGLSDFETDDELYWCLTGEPDIHLLCEAFSKKKQVDHPQAFVFEPKKGRVFLSTLGHDVRAYDAKEVKQLYRQGAAWAAGLE